MLNRTIDCKRVL